MRRSKALGFRLAEDMKTIQDCYSTKASQLISDLSPANETFKPVTNYEYFLNAKCKRRTPSALREITKTMSRMPSDTIKLAVGVPNSDTFPFKEISVELKDGSRVKLEGAEMADALQYMPSSGYGPLVTQLKTLQDKTHGPLDWKRSELIVTCGSSEPLTAMFDMIVSEGDPVIIPVPLYPGCADAMRALNPQYIALEQDKDGIGPEELEAVLKERVQQNKPLPKLMYINPTACNPTGRNVSIERKREIYRLACEYNFLIIEDDPYYSLHFMEEDIPSFLSMDVAGRVIRCDSFSKILSSGLRVGYATGPTELIRKIEIYLQLTTLHTSALSQVVVSKLLDHWGYEQYLAHIERVKKFYKEKRDQMLAACEKYLKGLAEWDIPLGGMFLWLKVPDLDDTWSLATERCLEKKLFVLPGHPFTGDLRPPQYNYLRISFSLASSSQMDTGIRLLSEIITELKSRK